MKSLRTPKYNFRILALSKRQEVIAAMSTALAQTGSSFQTFSDLAPLVAEARAAQLLLVDLGSIEREGEIAALQRLWSDQASEPQPLLIVIGNTEISRPLQRHALRILPFPLHDQSIADAVDAAQMILGHTQRLAEVESALQQRDELLAMLAHEVRNPLTTIQNVVDSLTLGAQTTDDVTALLSRQVSHLVRLLDSLYDFTYVSGDRLDLRREPLDLREVFAHALEMVDASLRIRNQQVRVHCDAEPVRVIGNRARLVQVVSNVLDNAAKYSAEGQLIDACVYIEHDWAVVTVRDFGEGIDADDLTRVFEPFVQRPSQPQPTRSGLGLGLAIVQRLVVLHGGTVCAKSDGRGCGSTFEIRFPRTE